MKRLALHYGFQSAATAVALTLSAPVMAGQIDSVCKTDDQTFNSIKSDPDQTLWSFMQAVCQGEFVITQAPTRPQAVAVNPPTSETSLLRADVTVAPIVRVGATTQSVTNPNNTSTTISHDEGVTASIETGALPEQSFLEIVTQPAETNEPSISLAKREKTPEQNRAEVIAQVQPDNTASHQGSQEIQTSKASDVQAIEDQETKEKGYQSSRPWLYSLLGPQVSSPVIDALPPPIEYKPSRFSNYEPDYVGESTASNHGTGYLQKPGIMSVVPNGFYLGTSLFWNRAELSNSDTYSALPSLSFGYADEKAVREFQTYPGLGSRFELKVQRLKDDEDRTHWNEFSALGEVYVPVGRGVFTGIGGKYKFDNDIPVQGVGSYDEEAWYAYLPIGIGFTNTMGHSGKVQLNTLIAAETKAKFSQLVSGSYSDPTAKLRAGGAYGLDFTYSWNVHSEAFVNYWWYDESEPFNFTMNGTTSTGRRSKDWTLDVGYRLYW